MSKCWYCNNELTTGDSPKHFGICNKCYDGMFKSSDTIIRSFTNKISDLEAKLAKSEKERELDNAFWKQECDSLQKTLVEKDKEIEKLTEELDDKNFCKDFVDLYTENKLKTQMLHENWKDKISFTLEQLEKAKNKIESKVESIYKILDDLNIKIVGESTSRELNAYEEIAKDIENQINELKGGK